ncbi:MAG: orotate phosphoribosyltransferase [Eubacteriales bacterium]|nr:orotate phosphoribosyltransferase [Eubacteriales bacterium]
MDREFIQEMEDIRQHKNRHVRIKIMSGHFATSNSHLNTYIDMSTVKTRHNNARETAKELAAGYVNTPIDSIVCLDDTNVIGAFLAENLAEGNQYSVNKGKNISVISPEYNALGQIMFRDNQQRMVRGMNVLVLAASVTTGKTLKHAVNSVNYYRGKLAGVCAVFSAAGKIGDVEIKRLFTGEDLPNYKAYNTADCPMCKRGERIEALINSFGYSKI